MIILISVIVFTVISLTSNLKEKHANEINRVIHSMGGKVMSIEKNGFLGDPNTPFKKEVGEANTIYKITYEFNGTTETAWYRGINVINDIHADTNKAFPEKWIMNEE
ncbi:hypothetical protein [Paenibacillus eucommiae]|uniref:DUF3139 domain-containing protein n=1 Tax=Paenibacillus eucommiae TaxID=1355755 RepID=A0ABS4IPY4_9BACL|nr:hypothetical protein [Paenibacillus eucommiae]MBP1989625.1 hypothetical protein [Paenibacillus eucommiae]